MTKSSPSSGACAELCFVTPGCHRFIFHTTDQCDMIFSSDRAKKYIYQSTSVYYSSYHERVTGTAGAVGTPACDEPPYLDEYSSIAVFSCKFRSAEDQEALVEKLKAENGVASDTPIGQWLVSENDSDVGKSYSSSFVFIDTGELDYSIPSVEDQDYYDSLNDYYGCVTGECRWNWVNFRVTTYSRFLPEFEPDGQFVLEGVRKRRSTPDALAAIRELSNTIVNKLMTDITLPEGVEVVATTPVDTGITMLAFNGDTSGKCHVEGCGCVNGYQKDGSGKCVPPADMTDTCSADSDICSEDASCITYSTGGSHCICNTGFHGDGMNCVDINECENFHVCPAHSICDNTQGAFQCTCDAGYQKVGTFCVDVNECHAAPCDGENQTCKNTDGSYECQCQAGYFLVDGDCELAVGLKTLNDLVDDLESTLNEGSDRNDKFRKKVRRRLGKLIPRMKRNFIGRLHDSQHGRIATGCDVTTTIGNAITDDGITLVGAECKNVQNIFITFANWVDTYNNCGEGYPKGNIGGKKFDKKIRKQLVRVRTEAFAGYGCNPLIITGITITGITAS